MSLCQHRRCEKLQECQHELLWVFESSVRSHFTSTTRSKTENTLHSLNKQADLTQKVEERSWENIWTSYSSRAPGRWSRREDFPVCCFPGCLHSHHNIQTSESPTCEWLPCYAPHPKSLWRWPETRPPAFWRVGLLDTSTVSSAAGNSEPRGDSEQGWMKHTYWDNEKDRLSEEKAVDKVQNWPSAEQAEQPNT